jgi:predicted nucleotidyltransferase
MGAAPSFQLSVNLARKPVTRYHQELKGSKMTRGETVDEVVRRLVEHYQPERIYLFGSSARGDARPESDLDFLVVLPDETPREKFLDGTIYERLWDIPLAVDIVPFHHRTFQERTNWLMSLPAIVQREGRLEYDAAAVSHSRGD